MRAAVYTRISLDKSGEGAGVERQREDCARLIKQREWTYAGEFSDNSISAAGKRKRPEFDALLAAVEADGLDMIVSWAWDRLSRNRRDEVALIEACRAHNVSVALVRGAGDLDMSSAVGRGIGEILATLGRMENEQKSERQRRALAQHAAQGKPWGPIPAFGYADDRVTVVSHEAELIRAAYAAVLAGASTRGIAAEWNSQGVLTRTWPAKEGKPARAGAPWSGSAVRRMLINPRYMGVRGTTVGTGNRRELREIGPAKWDGIVTEDVWRSVHATLTAPERLTNPGAGRVHLLPGIAVCGICGATMVSGRNSRGAPAYICTAGTRHLSRKAAPVDALVCAVVVERLSRPDARQLLVDDDRPDVGPLREEALTLRARLDSFAVEFADGELTASQLRIATERMRTRLSDVESHMISASRAPVLADLIGSGDVAGRFAALGLDRKRAVISTLLVPRILPARMGPGFDPASVEIIPVST